MRNSLRGMKATPSMIWLPWWLSVTTPLCMEKYIHKKFPHESFLGLVRLVSRVGFICHTSSTYFRSVPESFFPDPPDSWEMIYVHMAHTVHVAAYPTCMQSQRLCCSFHWTPHATYCNLMYARQELSLNRFHSSRQWPSTCRGKRCWKSCDTSSMRAPYWKIQ
jgi:hypothetical protein